jgi:aryl-alcohol dehydrogenase-like predicted oxidoreductase
MSDTTIPHPGGTWTLAGTPVARIGFGVMQLAELNGRPAIPAHEAIAIVRRAVELGITHFDTAGFYGDGEANRRLREALVPFADRDDIVLATKIGAVDDTQTARLIPAQKPAELRAQVEANLAQLGVDRLGVVNLRRLDNAPGIIATGDQIVDLDDQLAELAALREEGKLAGIGLSNVRLDQLQQALPAGIVCVQNYYNLLNRVHEDVLELCERDGIAWVPYFPLGSAFDRIAKVADQQAVRDAAAALGATPAQIALAWLLQHAPDILLITGTSNLDHLVENAAAGSIHLDVETVGRLDALGEVGAGAS